MPKIKVHEKALAHLSRGLYRSPASALRELVSNGWDANATIVRINTNFPNFLQLVVEDNGDGFTIHDFERLMAGGIGNSEKRPNKLKLKHGRPVVGRLGIGMLGIAQICGAFTVTSKTSDKKAFRARVHLYNLLKDKLDVNDPEVFRAPSNAGENIEVDVGEYRVETIDGDEVRKGTRIIADELHPTFVQSFKESLEFNGGKQPALEWAKVLKTYSSVRSLQELGDYWRLLWELAAACPIPYVNASAVPGALIKNYQRELEKFNFKLIVDGIELRKPIQLKGNEHGYSSWRLGPHTERIYGKELSFSGYVIVQEGKQLKPDEQRGLMIRIKNVAIGYYDPSMLDYRYNEGPRSRWVTGEIFVDSGLEDALNIDRDSFNRFHPDFRALQKYVHEFLQKSVFPGSYKKIGVRSDQRRKKKADAHSEHLKRVIATNVDDHVEIKTAAAHKTKSDSVGVEIEERSKGLKLSIPKELNTKKSNQPLAKSVLALFELALREKTKERQRNLFRRLLLELLEKW